MRIRLTNTPLVWFDPDLARCYQDHAPGGGPSIATGSDRRRQRLWHTNGKIWVLEHYDVGPGGEGVYHRVPSDVAWRWLIDNEYSASVPNAGWHELGLDVPHERTLGDEVRVLQFQRAVWRVGIGRMAAACGVGRGTMGDYMANKPVPPEPIVRLVDMFDRYPEDMRRMARDKRRSK